MTDYTYNNDTGETVQAFGLTWWCWDSRDTTRTGSKGRAAEISTKIGRLIIVQWENSPAYKEARGRWIDNEFLIYPATGSNRDLFMSVSRNLPKFLQLVEAQVEQS